MSVLTSWNKQLIDGVGKCSVPMWKNSYPDGFCDEPAYGNEEEDQQRYGEWIGGIWCPKYIPRLACYHHGGPKEIMPN